MFGIKGGDVRQRREGVDHLFSELKLLVWCGAGCEVRTYVHLMCLGGFFFSACLPAGEERGERERAGQGRAGQAQIRNNKIIINLLVVWLSIYLGVIDPFVLVSSIIGKKKFFIQGRI